jgi:PAS domain S-box-containing protein
VIDKDGQMLFCNLAGEALTGYSGVDLVGRNVSMLTPPDIRVKHDSFLRHYVRNWGRVICVLWFCVSDDHL